MRFVYCSMDALMRVLMSVCTGGYTDEAYGLGDTYGISRSDGLRDAHAQPVGFSAS